MIDAEALKLLYSKGLITEEALLKISSKEKTRPVSLLWDIRTLMYAGILLLTTGLGITVYKNIDTIGHLVIVIVIGILTIICFGFSIKKAPPFTFYKAPSSSVILDYVVLLGCMLMLIFIGYVQFQYNIFGNRWGLATLVPMIILFIAAYYFDHLGVLSMAIINLAAWMGITITPIHLLKANNFNDEHLIFTGLALGAFLLVLAYVAVYKNIKKDFYFTYKNFGVHLLFISLIAAMVHFENIFLLWFLILAVVAAIQFGAAFKEKSFYFIVITLLYFYIALSYVFLHFLLNSSFTEYELYITFMYFIVSGIGFIYLLTRINKQLKQS